MGANRNNSGFTLLEIIIAVALVAIMAVAIAPPLIKNLNEGKMARAQSDAQVLGNSIVSFYKDTGTWPFQNDADAAIDLTRLAGNASLGGGNTGIPAGAAGIGGGGNWDSWGTAGTFTNALIRNATATVDPLYLVSSNPNVTPGWNGPYLDRIPLDPWGHPFVINLRYGNPAVADYLSHTLMIVSAGPNGLFDTNFEDATHNEMVNGDDIGYVIRGSDQK